MGSVKIGNGKSYRLVTVLDKMIFSDLLKTVLAVLSVIVIIIVSRKFIKVLAKAIEGSLSNETVLSILGLKTVVATAAFLPASIFMAVLMVLGRMYRDQEMAAIASAGGGAMTLYRAVFLLVLPLSLAAAGLSMMAAPWAEARMQILMSEDESSADVRGISAGRFTEYSGGDLVFYAEDVDADGRMHNVFVQNREHGQLGVVNAKHGRMEYRPGGLYLVLERGERIQGVPGRKNYVMENFEEYGVRIEKKTRAVRLHRESVPTKELWRSEQLPDIAEMQNRLSTPLGVIFLAFLAVPLAKLSPRGGVYGSLMVAFAIYFVYGNLKRVSHSWVVNATIPVWMGYFWIYLLLLILGLALLVRLYGWKWVEMTLTGKAVR
ncbi:LPS export ABC transporter permease LptF [Methylomarinum sp. Ch1-1]|uniref:Lipopolysaccharide export system permease protein LptF n=1 Tax=Methylomarinum roseum TaxID=3067653 RepID=A0AAU7NXW2_9GAMM|nr:LPS export ABC transporter permease LptF [Methylomarinum sp. Ch1-1]MDP4522083.1 LPS export ABC transporter permease LptF [Methylomarinum sp. Ch1-1]